MSKKNAILLTTLVLAIFSISSAQTDTDSGKGYISLPEGVVLHPHGYGHFEAGQIVSGNLKNDDISTNNNQYGIDHVWTEDALVNLGLEVFYKKHLRLVFSLYSKLYFSYPQFFSKDRYTKNLRQDVSFDEVFAQFNAGNPDVASFTGQLGYFKYKYNPDVRNLGEYLFRTGTYPAFIDNYFDFPMQRLLGLRAEGRFFNSLTADLFFVSQTVYPAMNWSLAALVDYDVMNLHFIDIGAGIDFAHLLDVYTGHAFPADGGDPTQLNSDVNAYYLNPGDTTKHYYSFIGTKVMGRISIDPKAFIKWKYFGENDLKLYAEACIIGIDSFPDSGYLAGSAQKNLVAPSYGSIRDKTPIVVGFNFPTFKALDVLNIEVEYFSAKYYNDLSYSINKGSAPIPNPSGVVAMATDVNAPRKSDVKWTVYAKRSFFNGHFAITGLIGRDHMRLPCAQYDLEYWNDLLVSDKDWWWVLKTSWMF